jgi:hypothetical protein
MPVDSALIRDFCNLGYATACPHLPSGRDWDAVRFSVANSTPDHITISYICEFAHAPKAHGRLTYDLIAEAWREADMTNDARVRRLAASFLHAYRVRQSGAPLDLSVAG